MKVRLLSIVSTALFMALMPGASRGQEPTKAISGRPAPEYGPAKGTLVIIGGGSTADTGIMEKFIQLAGGNNAKFVIVPTAGGNKTAGGQIKSYKEESAIAPWKKRGLKNVRMLHTHDPNVADTEEFARPLAEADAVWFDGGRQWNIVDSYMNTLTYREFHKVLERGGVIAGSSAGATIQGDYLVRGAVAGPDIVMTPEKEHERGFNFLRKTAIDQHINTRKRWDDLIPVIKKYPDLLGIGLSEGTAIFVKGDRFEVMGAWKVAVHDNARTYQPWEKPYYVLSAGDVYNMKTRSIEKFGIGVQPRIKIAAGAAPQEKAESPAKPQPFAAAPSGFDVKRDGIERGAIAAVAQDLQQEPNTWVKRSPLPQAPLSPMLGYEGSFGYDPIAKRVIRWAGHNQGGGGEQNAETWTFDPVTAHWELKEPNISPPGVCCAQQNVFDPAGGRFLRFKGFSGNHGWQWFREIYLGNNAVWSYHLPTNTWRNMRTAPEPFLAPLRCASWDRDREVVVVFGGEGSNEGTLIYDPYANTWTRANPSLQPDARSAGNMAYDAKNKRHILFGTQFSDDPHTWAYDIAANKWIDRKPAIMPPTDKNDAVLAYDERNEVVVASIRVADKIVDKEVAAGHYETWIYDGAKNTWKPMKPAAEPPGGGNRRRIMTSVPEQNVVLMENYVNPPQKVAGVDREQQIWTYRVADAPAEKRLPAPQGVAINLTEKGATLRWNAVAGAERYIVTRWNGEQSWKATPVGMAPVTQTQALAPLAKGAKVSFTVRAENAAGASAPSRRVRTQPGLVEDVIASVLSKSEVKITWPRPSESEPVGYHVERAVVEVYTDDEIDRLRKDTPPLAEPSVGAIKAIGPFQQITKEPVRETTWTDKSVDLTKPAAIDGNPHWKSRFRPDQLFADGKAYRFAVYAYRVRAVNALGVSSGDGPYALTIPSSPQWFFSREAGDDCHLKWAQNPEAGLLGYRVYRMESPRVNGPGQKTTRLNAQPSRTPALVDDKIGTETRRYWVVAVDALGQEGFVSAPTWHYRQYRSYYVPFTGEWHQ